MRLCSIAGCSQPHKARGFCSRHHERWYKYGDPEREPPWKGRPPTVKTGERYGLLVVQRLVDNGGGPRRWLCLCDCGGDTVVTTADLRRTTGPTRSCGCLLAATHTTHGHYVNGQRTPTYLSWTSMRTRCSRSYGNAWKYYGARGIKVCDRWLDSFENFLEDMGERPDGKTLDRIDVDGNYEPGNCRWATPKEQSANRRVSR
jgi:hypothetical protein